MNGRRCQDGSARKLVGRQVDMQHILSNPQPGVQGAGRERHTGDQPVEAGSKPATGSLVSEGGPSMTRRPAPSKAARLRCTEGWPPPSAASKTSALRMSPLNLPIASSLRTDHPSPVPGRRMASAGIGNLPRDCFDRGDAWRQDPTQRTAGPACFKNRESPGPGWRECSAGGKVFDQRFRFGRRHSKATRDVSIPDLD